MNKIFYFGSAALMSTVMFTGCQSEEMTSGVNEPGRKVSMRVGLTYDNGEKTRTAFTEVDGSLKCTWEATDKVFMCNENGDGMGLLDLVEGAGEEFAWFESDDISVFGNQSEVTVNFHYLGKGFDPEEVYDNTYTSGGAERYKIVHTTQSGHLEDLTKYDILRGQATVHVENKMAYCENMNMKREAMSYAHFTLSLPEGVTRNNEEITITDENGYLYGAIGYAFTFDKGTSHTDRVDAITIGGANVKTGNDFYVALPSGAIQPTFKVTIGGKEYSCTLPNKMLSTATYYNDLNSNGIKLEMTAPAGVNPLLKWAETDLIKVSGGASATSKFADSPYTSGSYYQFGRNQGYTNGADAANNYTYCISNNYNSSGNVYRGVQGNTTPATRYAPSNPSNPSYFYIGYNMSGDYKTPVKTEDWETRAKANGYTYVDPLNDPEWRIPTVEDYYEILPDDGNGNHGFLGTGLYDGGTAQIKTLKDGTRCAFLWSANYTPDKSGLCLEILCKVIGDDVTSVTADDDEFWSDAEARYFKASGFIQAWYGSHSDQGGTQYIARPLDWGKYVTQRNMYTEVVAYLVRNQSWMSEGGFYWTSDKEQKMFCFSLNFNYNTNIQDQLAFVQINGSAAANIRMIKK